MCIMTNKVQKIREEVEKHFEQIKNSKRESDSGAFYQLKELLEFIDSLQEEPVSKDLEEAADNALNNVLNTHEIVNVRSCLEMFRFGSKWKEQQMMANAIDGKVIANGMGNPILHLWDKGKHLIDKEVKVIVVKED